MVLSLLVVDMYAYALKNRMSVRFSGIGSKFCLPLGLGAASKAILRYANNNGASLRTLQVWTSTP